MDDKEIKVLVGKRVKQLRKSLGLSQFALGEKIDIDQRQVACIEGGKSFPSLPTLNKLTKVFECDLKTIFDYNHLVLEDNLRKYLISNIENASYSQLQLFAKILNDIKEI